MVQGRVGRLAYWTVLYKKPNEHHEFFTSKKCTQNQAWTQFERSVPSQSRGRVIHIHEEGTFNFHTYPDHTVSKDYDAQVSIYT